MYIKSGLAPERDLKASTRPSINRGLKERPVTQALKATNGPKGLKALFEGKWPPSARTY